MPIGDYQAPDTNKPQFEALPKGPYQVYLSNVNGDISAPKPYANFEFMVENGEYKGRKIFKRYYLTEKTLQKFIPWQFGIMGLWDDVKLADSFSHGIEIVIDKTYGLIGKISFSADVEIEEYQAKDGTMKQKNNIVLKQNLGDRTSSLFDEDEPFPL